MNKAHELALEALKSCIWITQDQRQVFDNAKVEKAITALEQEQAEQEPVAYGTRLGTHYQMVYARPLGMEVLPAWMEKMTPLYASPADRHQSVDVKPACLSLDEKSGDQHPAAPQPPSAQPASTAQVMEADLPPLPEPVDYALFAGVAMQGSEIRPLSNNYEPGCAQYTADQMREYALAFFRSLSTEPGKT